LPLAHLPQRVAIIVPNARFASNRQHKHGELALSEIGLLSMASCPKAANWAKPARIAPGMA
jgi:hypothetical protein